MLQSNDAAHAVGVAEFKESFTDNGLDLASTVKRHGPNGTYLAVGHVKCLTVAGQAAGLSKGSLFERAVSNILTPVAGVRSQVILREVQDPDLMVSRHGDVE